MNLKQVVFAASLLAFGCSGSSEKKSSLLSDPADGYVSSVPSDTPFVFAAVDPFPWGLMVDKMAGIGVMYEEFLASLEPLANDPHAMDSERKAYAVMREFSGLFQRDGIERVGLSLNPRFAVYGLGLFPAMRMELQDPEAFKAFIGRLEMSSGVQATEAKLGQFEYRVFAFDDLLVPVAFQGNTLVVGALHEKAADPYLGLLLGETKAEKSLAQSKSLSVLKDKYNFKGFGIGYINIQKIVSLMTQKGTDIHAQIMQKVLPEGTEMNATCQSEFAAIAANYPRVVMGYDQLDENAMKMRMGHEMTNGLGEQLAKTKTQIPGFESKFAQDSMIRLGFGFDVGLFSQVIIGKAAEIANAPFQCADLAEFNRMAGQIAQAGFFLPPMVSQIKGASVAIKDLDTKTSDLPQGPDGSMNQNSPLSANAIGLIATADGPGLFEAIRMLVPELSQFVVKDDGLPVRIDAPEVEENVRDVYVALRGNGIGLSLGEGSQNQMADALMNPGTAQTPWLSMVYDLARVAELVGDSDPSMSAFKKLFEHGQLRIDVTPTQDGIFMSYEQEFKN